MQDATRRKVFFEGEGEDVSEQKSWFQSEAATRWVYGAVGLLVIGMVFTFLQFSTRAVCCGDFDGYYHIRWSQLLWENISSGKWLPEFIWLPLTVLSPDSYADHHFLFHLLQIPFLWFFEPIMAAKVAAVFYATLAVFSCYWLLLRYKVDYPLVWLLGLLTCANPFYYRMNMAKAPPLSIIFSIIGAWLLFERRYIWLLPLTFVFTWAYSFYPIIIVASLIWAGIIYWNENKIEWKPIAFAAGGAVAGNIINPYFPNNLLLFWEHFWTKFRVSGYDVPVGGEWYPYDTKALLGLCAVAMLAMFVGYVLYMPSEKKLDEKSTFFLLLATALMVWIFQSKRYAEYFPPMAILFAAFAFQSFKNNQTADSLVLPEDFTRDLSPYFDKNVETPEDDKREIWKIAFVGLISGMLIIYMFFMMRGIDLPNQRIVYKGLALELSDNDPPERFQKAMEWAAKNIPAKDENGKPVRIFNTDWDDFPKLFFHDTKHAYIAGLDPNYLYSRSPELWKHYEEITTGKTDDPAPIIKEKFGARYVFSDLHHDDFYAKIMESGWADKIYEDDDSMILKIRDEKGVPPAEGDAPAGNDADEIDDVEVTNENTTN